MCWFNVGSLLHRWTALEIHLYMEKQAAIFKDEVKLMVAADPSGYSGQKTMVAMLWSGELQSACYLPIQVMPASKLFGPTDVDMCERLTQLAFERKLERTAAYREWQGLSHGLFQICGRSIDQFGIPECVQWKPVREGQRREWQGGVHSIVDLARGRTDPVLPASVDLGCLPQLTVAIDSGSVGRAAANFAKHKMHANVFIIYDKIHRLIRDIKLAMEHTGGKELYKATLHANFIFSLNQKPFGSGEWFHKKAESLAHFIECHTSESSDFRAYAPHIAQDLGLVIRDETDYESVFNCLPEMPSFSKKGIAPKSMRWFSINQVWHEHKGEMFTLRMVLEHYNGDDVDLADGHLDPAAAMQADPKKDDSLRARQTPIRLFGCLLLVWFGLVWRSWIASLVRPPLLRWVGVGWGGWVRFGAVLTFLFASLSRTHNQELQALRAMGGGMKLATQLITPWLRRHMRLYCAGTKVRLLPEHRCCIALRADPLVCLCVLHRTRDMPVFACHTPTEVRIVAGRHAGIITPIT